MMLCGLARTETPQGIRVTSGGVDVGAVIGVWQAVVGFVTVVITVTAVIVTLQKNGERIVERAEAIRIRAEESHQELKGYIRRVEEVLIKHSDKTSDSLDKVDNDLTDLCTRVAVLEDRGKRPGKT